MYIVVVTYKNLLYGKKLYEILNIFVNNEFIVGRLENLAFCKQKPYFFMAVYLKCFSPSKMFVRILAIILKKKICTLVLVLLQRKKPEVEEFIGRQY